MLVLDQKTFQLMLDEQRQKCKSLAVRLEAVRREIAVQHRYGEPQRLAKEAAMDELRAQISEAQARSVYADKHLDMSERLSRSAALSSDELSLARTDAAAARTKIAALRQSLSKLEQDRKVQEIEQEVRLAHLEREAVDLEQEGRGAEAAVLRMEHDVEVRVVRAAIDGRVGEVVASFQPGSAVKAADRLGSVVPDGAPRVVASFPVASAGRLCPGQSARLRLDGFAWSEFGTMPATVTQVGSEPQGGRLRVELTLLADPDSALPREHGLSGVAEVEVERASPLTVLLRAAGQILHPRPAAPESAPERAKL